ncbi:MAG: VWA domain-containing protein [Phycisphaerae bacterium]|nr:VWA domain-containing protein [Phycisphaerae bacterium]
MGGQREHSTHVVDHSGSMGEKFRDLMTKLVATQRACSNMIISKERIDPADEIGLVAFNHAAQVLLPISPLSTHKRQMLEVLQTLTAGGGTDINAGLKAARDLFDWGRQDVVRRVILLTDGHGGEPLATAEDLKGRGVVIDVIGIGPTPNHVNEKLLRKVASFIDGELHYRFIKDQRTLVDHYTRLAGKTKVGV